MTATFIVMSASAKVHGRAKQYGPYRHLAVVELEPGFTGTPKMISPRAKGIASVIYDSGAIYAGGKTARSSWQKVMAYVEKICGLMNEGMKYGSAVMAEMT